MHIALLGGAFNPPHIGHFLIAQQVLDYARPEHGRRIDEVWFLPNYGQKYFGQESSKIVAPAEDRVSMLRTMETPRIKVSTLEIEHQLDGQTIRLLPHLPSEHTFSFIIGSDQLPTFHLWSGWKELLSTMHFLVFPRHGFTVEPLYEGMQVVDGGGMLITTDISSTKIRQRIQTKLPMEGFVLPGVASYIREHELYLEGVRGKPETRQ